MRTFVPFDAVEPKTRLSPVLSSDERHAFARVLLADVLDTLSACGREPTVLANAPLDIDTPVLVDDRPLTDAVNGVLAEKEGPVAVVMADLGLATPEALSSLYATDDDVVLAPGRGGGTNAFCARHPSFRVDYHGASIRDHRAIAREIDASTETIDSFRLSTDIDEPIDLAELLLHGDGQAAEWLANAGIGLEVNEGRVGVTRL